MNRGKVFKEYMLIIIGTAFMAISVNSIFDPLEMVTGGFSGIAIIIKRLTTGLIDGGLPLWLTTIILNIPLFLVGVKLKGFDFLKKTLAGTISLSIWLYILPVFALISDDLILAALIGGVIQGMGIGLAFMGKGTTGGSDMVAALLQTRLKHYSVSQLLQLVDGSIVLMGVFVFGISSALYAALAIYIISKVSDSMIEGVNFCKTAFIITNHFEEVSKALMAKLNRGVSGITIQGMYSRGEKKMLFCVVAKKQIITLKEVIDQVDPTAFVIVSDAREVLGEGFIQTFRLEK